MKLDGVHHIGVNVRDLDRAEAFYTEVLGFKVIDRYQEEIRHSMLDTGAAKIHLFESIDLKFDEAIHRLSEDGYAHIIRLRRRGACQSDCNNCFCGAFYGRNDCLEIGTGPRRDWRGCLECDLPANANGTGRSSRKGQAVAG